MEVLVSRFYLVLAEASSPVPMWLCKRKVPGCSDGKCPKDSCGLTLGCAFHFPDPSLIPHPRVSSSFLRAPSGIESSTSHTVLSISRCSQVKLDSLKNCWQSKSTCLLKSILMLRVARFRIIKIEGSGCGAGSFLFLQNKMFHSTHPNQHIMY